MKFNTWDRTFWKPVAEYALKKPFTLTLIPRVPLLSLHRITSQGGISALSPVGEPLATWLEAQTLPRGDRSLADKVGVREGRGPHWWTFSVLQ